MYHPFFAHPSKLFPKGLPLLTVSRGKKIQEGKKKKKFFFVLHFSLATFYYQGLDKCKNKEQSFAVAQSRTTDNYSSKMMDIFFSANDSKRM